MTRSSEPAAWRLDIDDLARRDAPGLHAPDVVRFSPDGGSVTYLHGPGLVRSLWRMDLGTGERRPYVHNDLGFVVDLGGTQAAANPPHVPLSGLPAKVVTRGWAKS